MYLILFYDSQTAFEFHILVHVEPHQKKKTVSWHYSENTHDKLGTLQPNKIPWFCTQILVVQKIFFEVKQNTWWYQIKKILMHKNAPAH